MNQHSESNCDSWNNENDPESDGPIKYLRQCSYERTESCQKKYEYKFEFISDFSSKPASFMHAYGGSFGEIIVEFIPNDIRHNEFPFIKFSEENGNRIIKGPDLSSECTITGVERADYDREFGYIQSSKIFFERIYDGTNADEENNDRTINRVDFLENSLRNQDKVLDTVGGNDPFYSEESYHKVPAGEIPPCEIKVKLRDCPESTTPLEFNRRSLQNIERYQKFYVNLVMRYLDCGEWKYDVIYSFDWFIYWNWNNRNYECGIIEHTHSRDLLERNDLRTCNKDQFVHGIDLLNNQFHITDYPDFVSERKLFYEIITKFHSNPSGLVPADGIPLDKIKVRLLDWIDLDTPKESIYIIELSIESNLLFVQNLERNQQFCSFVILECWDRQGWKHVLLHTYDYFNYLNLFRPFNGCKSTTNRHRTIRDLLEIHIFRTCVKEQFELWINFGKDKFHVFHVIDLFREIITKFNSNENCSQVTAGDIPPDEIKFRLFDCTDSTTPIESIFGVNISSELNVLFLQYLETYQQFCGFIIFGYWNNRDWKYVVCHTYDWIIYWNWCNSFTAYEIENQYEHQQNRHRALPDLLEINIYRTCSEEQFKNWTNLEKSQFNIFNYPGSVFVEEIFRKKVKNAVIQLNSN